jgi:hypothetical protein
MKTIEETATKTPASLDLYIRMEDSDRMWKSYLIKQQVI